MPVKLQIVGMKRNKGTSKRTGKPFDICDVYFLYEDRFIDGMGAGKWKFDGPRIDAKDIRVGDMVDALLFFKDYEIDRVYIM